MKIISNEIRPIGFVQLEINENEIQTILGVFEQVEYLMDNPEYHQGARKDIKEILMALIQKK